MLSKGIMILALLSLVYLLLVTMNNNSVEDFLKTLKRGNNSIPSDQIFEVARATIKANEILQKTNNQNWL